LAHSLSQSYYNLRQAESEVQVPDICREHGISQGTFYKWRAKFSGMDVSLMKRMRELEEENTRLKRMYANVQMDKEILAEALEKKF